MAALKRPDKRVNPGNIVEFRVSEKLYKSEKNSNYNVEVLLSNFSGYLFSSCSALMKP